MLWPESVTNQAMLPHENSSVGYIEATWSPDTYLIGAPTVLVENSAHSG